MNRISTVLFSFFMALSLISNISAQEIKFETTDGKFKITGTVGYYVANGKAVESPNGNEKGLSVVIIRPDGKPTNPVPVKMLSKKTKQILFGKTSNAKPDFLEKGLLGYYKLDGASSQNDVSEEKNPWIVGGQAAVFDRFGNPNGATTCGEGNGYLPLSHDDPAKYALREFTISVWFKWKNDHPSHQYRVLLCRGTSGNLYNHNYMLHIYNRDGDERGLLGAGVSGGKGKENFISSTTVVADGKWHHVALVVNEKLSSSKLYIDGKKENQGEVKDVRVLANLGTTLGVWSPDVRGNGYGHFNGDLDDLRIYKKPLTDAEVKKLYEYESKPPAIEKPSNKDQGR